MTQAFDDYAASRPKPTLPPEYSDNPGVIGTLFTLMREDDRRNYVWTRNAIATHITRLAGGEPGND